MEIMWNLLLTPLQRPMRDEENKAPHARKLLNMVAEHARSRNVLAMVILLCCALCGLKWLQETITHEGQQLEFDEGNWSMEDSLAQLPGHPRVQEPNGIDSLWSGGPLASLWGRSSMVDWNHYFVYIVFKVFNGVESLRHRGVLRHRQVQGGLWQSGLEPLHRGL